MRSILLAALAGLALTSPVEAGLFIPKPSPSATPSPAASPLVDVRDFPYEPRLIRRAIRQLLKHKGVPAADFHRDQSVLVTSREDLGRFFAYLAVASHAEGKPKWAIIYYCQAIKADPRYVGLETIPPDEDKTFLPALQVIKLETLLFFADHVAQPVDAIPSQLPLQGLPK